MALWDWLRRLFGRPRRAGRGSGTPAAPFDATTTWEAADPERRAVSIVYAPRRDGAPDAGEIVWAWVPFQEDPAQGKDRPMLVIARHDVQRVYAVKLTSRAPQGGAARRNDHVAIGTGPWDRQGRESWVDVDQLYSVHHRGIRREAAALDRRAFARVARVVAQRHGWRFDG